MGKRIAMFLRFVLSYLLLGGLLVIVIWLYAIAPTKFIEVSAAILITLVSIIIVLFILHDIKCDYHRALYTHHLILLDRKKEWIK